MLKATPSPEVEKKIRQLAHKAGLPVTQYLNPYLQAIADGHLVFRPQVVPPPAPREVDKAA